MGPVPQHGSSRERSMRSRLVGRRLVSEQSNPVRALKVEVDGESGSLQAGGTLKKHSATEWALASRSAAARCAAKCRNQHRRGYDWPVAAGVPGAKMPGEGDLPVIDGSLGRGRELEQDWRSTTVL
jgi:hypothetical protein